MSKNDGGNVVLSGISLRDLIAIVRMVAATQQRGITNGDPRWFARDAYELADAMIAERAK